MFEVCNALNEVIVECDECGHGETFFGRTFHEAWPEAKDFGWRAVNLGKKRWKHVCRMCVEKWAESQKINGNS